MIGDVKQNLKAVFCSLIYEKQFVKIEKWAHKVGYTIRFGRTDECDYYKRELVVQRNQKDINIIYSVLHECGHSIIGGKRSYHKKFKSIVKADIDGRHTKSNLYRFKKLKEEIDAWEEGYKLAKKLRIDIDKDHYDVYAAKCVNTYIKYL